MGLDRDRQELASLKAFGLSPERTERLRVGAGIAGQAVAQRRPAQRATPSEDSRFFSKDPILTEGFRALLSILLAVADRALGVLNVFRPDAHESPPAEVQVPACFADRAAVAQEHARLYGEADRRRREAKG